MSTQTTKIARFTRNMLSSIQCERLLPTSDHTSMLKKNIVTLQNRLPELGIITVVLQHVRISHSRPVRWKCYTQSEHCGLLYRTLRMFSSPDEALLEMYVHYRQPLVEFESRRGRRRCSCCNVDLDEEESEDGGYGEV